MKIAQHVLVPEGTEKIFTSKKSPNQRNLTTADQLPKDLIIHYTACSLEAALNTFMSSNGTSAHLVIDLDGSIHQMVPFNRQAFHAGSSVWDDNSSFNGRAIGIELVNFGWDVEKVSPADRVNLKHKHKFVGKTQWHIYSPKQLATLFEVTKLLLSTYELHRILGHDDISAGRKQDPGPAFPWDEFRMHLFGTTNNVGKIFKTKVEDVNLRKGDGTQFEALRKLKKGVEVGLIETWNNWSKVYLANSPEEVVVNEKVNGKITQKSIKTMGWIRSDLLEPK
ncbi:N-acetylmuramoyl-L-alanine amidase [Runella sp.]|uniref:N-acetylmuramoyl-L-alanine amidase n=1 Tax=Runella sp. TaxID=1960881 RepID=UPI003D0BF61F